MNAQNNLKLHKRRIKKKKQFKKSKKLILTKNFDYLNILKKDVFKVPKSPYKGIPNDMWNNSQF